MKIILRSYGIGMNQQQRYAARLQARDMTIARGTSRPPLPPQDITAQGGPRGILLTWGLATGLVDDIVKWRVYRGDENTLYHELNDRGVRQIFVDATAGASPPTTNMFVSSVNSLGVESPKVLVSGTATAESGAPVMPQVPPNYNSGSGMNKQTGPKRW